MTEPKTTTRRILVCALALGLMLTAAAAVEARTDRAAIDDPQPPVVPTGGGATAEGAGYAQFPGCAPTIDYVTVTGSGSDGVWSFVYTTENIGCDGWTNSATMTGAWDPAVGGCIPFNFFYQMCLENPLGDPSIAAVYDYSNTFDANAGTVALVFS